MSLGPAALTASLPAAVGRPLADELVLVGVGAPSLDALAVYTLPLSVADAEGEAEAVTVVRAGVAGMVADGASRTVVLVYADDTSPDSTAARFAATAVGEAEAAGLGVLDVIAVTGGRWRSYGCTNPSCCPPEGRPIITGESTP